MIFGIIVFQIVALIAFVYIFSKYNMNHLEVKKLEMKKAEEYQIQPFNKDKYFDMITKLSVELGKDFERFKEENKVYTLWWGAEGIQLKNGKTKIVTRFLKEDYSKNKELQWNYDVYEWSKKQFSKPKLKESKPFEELYFEAEHKPEGVFGGKGNQVLTVWETNTICLKNENNEIIAKGYEEINSKKEIIKLIALLKSAKIPYKILTHPPFDWITVIIYYNKKEILRATQSDYSYGSKENLIEIKSDFAKIENGYDEDVIGWLNAEEVFKKYLKYAMI